MSYNIIRHAEGDAPEDFGLGEYTSASKPGTGDFNYRVSLALGAGFEMVYGGVLAVGTLRNRFKAVVEDLILGGRNLDEEYFDSAAE